MPEQDVVSHGIIHDEGGLEEDPELTLHCQFGAGERTPFTKNAVDQSRLKEWRGNEHVVTSTIIWRIYKYNNESYLARADCPNHRDEFTRFTLHANPA